MMTPDVVDCAHRMLEDGATRQQVADVIGVGGEDDLEILSCSLSIAKSMHQYVTAVIKIDRRNLY